MKNWPKILGRVLLGRFEDPPEPKEPATEAPVVHFAPPPRKPTLQFHSSSHLRAARSENGAKLHLTKSDSSNSPLLCGAKRDRAAGWIPVSADDPRICKNCLKKSPTRRVND